jgi:hypothetical protein
VTTLLAFLPETTPAEGGTNALLALGVAVLFAVIYLSVRRAGDVSARSSRERFLSVASGFSIAYVFVHVLPGLARVRELQSGSATGFKGLFPEYSVYLWTMAGFLVFSGLGVLDARSRLETEGERSLAPRWLGQVEIGGFAGYAWLLTYLMVWTGKGTLALGLYAVAMAMHVFPIALNLRRHYPALYETRGAFLLAGASLAGWACAVTLDIPTGVVVILAAFVAGGVIVNGAIAELPNEKKGQYGPFLAGTVVYTAVLLVLSHFE